MKTFNRPFKFLSKEVKGKIEKKRNSETLKKRQHRRQHRFVTCTVQKLWLKIKGLVPCSVWQHVCLRSESPGR